MRSMLTKTLPSILATALTLSAFPAWAQQQDPNPRWQQHADGSTSGWQGDQPQPDVNDPAMSPNGVPPQQGWNPGQNDGMGAPHPTWGPGPRGMHHGPGPAMVNRDNDHAMQERQQGDVTYISGGVGLDESRRLLSEAHHYPLTLSFLGSNREYLSDVHVRIVREGDDTVLDTHAEGPYLLAKLPSGRYTVHVAYHGQEQTRRVMVGGRGSVRANFVWATHDD